MPLNATWSAHSTDGQLYTLMCQGYEQEKDAKSVGMSGGHAPFTS